MSPYISERLITRSGSDSDSVSVDESDSELP